MSTVLVVANETLASRSLLNAVRERHSQHPDESFVLVVPTARPKSGLVSYDDVLRDAAQSRIDMTLAALREHGIEATGEVMDPDPFSAIDDAVAEYHPASIIVSTHPETRSGWLRRDLIERVHEETGLPVQHVVVDLELERDGMVHTLVVANQTVTGRPLHDLLVRKAAEGPHTFIVLVPQQGKDGQHLDEARERLLEVLDELRGDGIEAVGSVGDPDPFTAIMNALSFYRIDEIVISSLPETRSGWLRADLVERVRRSASEPVEHVVVDVEGAGEATDQAAARSQAS